MAYFRCGGGVPSSVKTLPTYKTASGSVATFETDMTENLISCVCDFSASGGGGTPDAPIAISGFDSGVITRCGKNLFDKDNADVINAYIASNGTYTTANPSTKSIYIKIKPNTTYTISKSASSGFSVGTTDHILQSGDVISNRIVNYQGATSLTITSGASDKYLYAWVYTSGQDSGTLDEKLATVQIEESATATTFEAYNGTTFTVNFGQTVYGGSVDVVTGKINKTWHGVLLSDLAWAQNVYNPSIFNGTLPYNAKSANTSYFKSDEYTSTDSTTALTLNNSVAISSARTVVYCHDERYTDVNTFKNNVTGFLIYELNTEQTEYASNSLEIPTINGTNNLFADTGDISEAKYILSVGEALRQG